MPAAPARLSHFFCTCALALLLTATAGISAQCVELEFVQINGCTSHPNPSGSVVRVETEYLIFRTRGEAVPVAELGVDFPFNGFGARNGDILPSGEGMGDAICRAGTPQITNLPGLADAIALGPTDVIPSNSFVVLFTSATTTNQEIAGLDFSSLPGLFNLPVYILQNACARSVGAFANNPPASGNNPERTVGVRAGCGTSSITYDTRSLTGEDGDYYSASSPTPTANSPDCTVPDLPFYDLCPVQNVAVVPDCTTGPEGSEYLVNLAAQLADEWPDATFYTGRTFDPAANPVTELRGIFGETVSLIAVQLDLATECVRISPIDLVFSYLRGAFVCEPIVDDFGLNRGLRTSIVDTVGTFDLLFMSSDTLLTAFENPGTEISFDTLPAGTYIGMAITEDSCFYEQCSITIDEPFSCPVLDTTLTFTFTGSAPQPNPITGGIFTSATPRDSLVLQTAAGCDSIVYTVAIFTDTFRLRNERLYLPTAFSPNGDGVNDVLRVGSGDDIQVARTRVHDRWGALVYEGTDGWDGMVKGERAPHGVYVLTVEAVTSAGRMIRKSGAVSLL